MNRYEDHCFNRPFSHIYIEKRAADHEMTRAVLKHFPDARIIMIDHYKDVFNRSRQQPMLQQKARSLILAAKEGTLIYPGAPVCQNFGHRWFYYTSCQMNCLFDCEYCYLKGMYPSGHMVMFVNLEDYFSEISRMLESHPMYLCISYDSDLLAVEKIFGYVGRWQAFAKKHPDLTIEVRTKAAPADLWDQMQPLPNMIYAFTISPQHVIDHWEHHTPPLEKRLACAAKGIEMGYHIRLCFDPMLKYPGWKADYEEMLSKAGRLLDLKKVRDFSIGTFRIPADYLKRMRQLMPDSPIVWYPYSNIDGVCRYDPQISDDMEQFMEEGIYSYAPDAMISRWET